MFLFISLSSHAPWKTCLSLSLDVGGFRILSKNLNSELTIVKQIIRVATKQSLEFSRMKMMNDALKKKKIVDSDAKAQHLMEE